MYKLAEFRKRISSKRESELVSSEARLTSSILSLLDCNVNNCTGAEYTLAVDNYEKFRSLLKVKRNPDHLVMHVSKRNEKAASRAKRAIKLTPIKSIAVKLADTFTRDV